MTTKKLNKGFSLVEMIVYISILSVMLLIIIEVVLSVTRSERVMRSARSVENSAVSALERINREVKFADSINVSESLFAANPGKLVVEKADGPVEFYMENGRLMVDDGSPKSLTEERAFVRDLKFFRYASDKAEGVKTEIVIESGTSTYYKIEKFYSSSSLR